MVPTFFGAAIADMDFEKLGLSVGDVLERLRQVDPAIWGSLAGGAVGGLGTASLTEEEDPNRAAKIMLGLTLGAAGGGLAGRHFGPGLGLGERPTPPVAVPARTAASPAAIRSMEAPPPPAGRVNLSPVTPSADLPVNVRARAVSGPATEARLRQTEQSMRQQATQQMDQAMVQSSLARERAALMKDQGKVQARLQAFMAPGRSAGGRPRVVTLAPGVRSLQVAPQTGGMKGPFAQKTAGLLEDIIAKAKEHPWIPGAVAGGALGTGLGWSTSDPKTRKRKMLMGLLLGAPVGALSAETVNSIINAMKGVEAASSQVKSTAESPLAEEALKSIIQATGGIESASGELENVARQVGSSATETGGLLGQAAGAVAQQAPGLIQALGQYAKTGSLEDKERELVKWAGFRDFIAEHSW